jgi:hypothetical protein
VAMKETGFHILVLATSGVDTCVAARAPRDWMTNTKITLDGTASLSSRGALVAAVVSLREDGVVIAHVDPTAIFSSSPSMSVRA